MDVRYNFRAATQQRHDNSGNQRKEEGKDQESIPSSTTPDQGHHMESDKNTRKHNTQKCQ